MKKPRLTARARAHLDARLGKLPRAIQVTPPAQGWVKAIRGALGMTTVQLAKRMRVRQPTIIDLEQSEAKGSIELATLRRAAEALNCNLIYALIPRKPLETMVRERARAFMRRRLKPIEHSMLLEDQKVVSKNEKAAIEEILRETNPRLFWD